jgi:putative SOS response-associated peptidase YedK
LGADSYWSKDQKIGYSTISAKAKTIASSAAFREAIENRRCLVPADALYEWQKLDARTKQLYAIALKSRGMPAFAGEVRKSDSRASVTPVPLRSFF